MAIRHGSSQDREGDAVFDLAVQVDPRCKGFSGAVFDGRFVYYIPLNNGAFHGVVTRCDTRVGFADPQSWTCFDTAQVDPDSRGFVNGVFDGRFVYLVPYNNGVQFGQVTRYDTQADFARATSWEVFDTVRVDSHSKGFVGGVFDGRFVYLVPYQLDYTTHHGQVTRFDSEGDFTREASWDVFNMVGVHPDCTGYHTGLFDGRFVYFCPYLRSLEPLEYASRVTRYDSRSASGESESWEGYDTTRTHPLSKGFIGSVFDGRFVYFVPYHNGRERHGRVARYDTRGGFAEDRSWEVFDICQIDENSRGFFGGIFDGRYIYFTPHCKAPDLYHGQVTRYDTQGDFTSADSWRFFDTGEIHPNNKGFIGGVFDGRFVYLPPFETEENKHSGQTVRIDTHAPGIWE